VSEEVILLRAPGRVPGRPFGPRQIKPQPAKMLVERSRQINQPSRVLRDSSETVSASRSPAASRWRAAVLAARPRMMLAPKILLVDEPSVGWRRFW